MNKKQLFRHLDESNYLPDDPEQRDLASLLAEVRDADAPDPGDIYWKRFNQRLEKKLESSQQPKAKRRWMEWSVWGTLAAAAALVLLIWTGSPDSVNPPSLEDLSDEGLAALCAVFPGEDEELEEPLGLDTAEMDVLLQAYDADYETLLFELEGEIQENMQLLKSNWDLEG